MSHPPLLDWNHPRSRTRICRRLRCRRLRRLRLRRRRLRQLHDDSEGYTPGGTPQVEKRETGHPGWA